MYFFCRYILFSACLRMIYSDGIIFKNGEETNSGVRNVNYINQREQY